jgi:hypothetical protein
MSEFKVDIVQKQSVASAGGILQRKCPHCRKKKELMRNKLLQRRAISKARQNIIPPIVHEVLRSPGQQMDREMREFMEMRFGHDIGRTPLHSVSIQTSDSSLKIGPADDIYEQEAERTADRVMRDPNESADVEPVFGSSLDFSQVHLHTDSRAAESARAVNALAYTVGQNIVFGSGHYAPRTAEGKRILAHELTHVLQQSKLLSEIKPDLSLKMIPVVDANITSIVQRVVCEGRKFKDCSPLPCKGPRGRNGRCQWIDMATGCICLEYGIENPISDLAKFLPAWLLALLTAAAIAAIVACFASGACEFGILVTAAGYGLAVIIAGILRNNGIIITGEDPTASLGSTENIDDSDGETQNYPDYSVQSNEETVAYSEPTDDEWA